MCKSCFTNCGMDPKYEEKNPLHVHLLIKLRPHSKALKRPLLEKILRKIAAEPIRGATSYHVTSRDNDMISENLDDLLDGILIWTIKIKIFSQKNSRIGIGHTYRKSHKVI